MPPIALATMNSTIAATIQPSPYPKPASCTSQRPNTNASRAPAAIATTAARIRPKSTTTSLGRSRRNAIKFNAAAIATPPTSRKTPVMWRTISHSNVVTGQPYNREVDETARHLRLLTETIAAVNSTLDLEEVLSLVAREVADALGADACFVYLYDEQADELVLRATFGTRVEEMTGRPRMRQGEGITGTAAAARAPVMIAAQAHLDERFKAFPNLREDDYESILAVPILAREKLEGALNVRTREPREFSRAEIDLLVAIAAQVAQTIEHAKLYAQAQRRVVELEALARISEAVSESLYLEESLEGIVEATVDALGATGAAIVLEDGEVGCPACRSAGRVARSGSLSATATRRSPPTTAPCSARLRATPLSPWSTGARCCAGCSRKRSIIASRTTCRRSPRCCGCRPGPTASMHARHWTTASIGSSRSPRCTRC